MLDRSKGVWGNLGLDGGNIGIENTMDEYWKGEYGFIQKLPQYVKECSKNVGKCF